MSSEEKSRANKEKEVEDALEEQMRILLSPEAKSRLTNVKLANRELYRGAAQAIIYLYRAGRIQGKLGESQLKQLLEKLSQKREIRIKRK
ncbi:MAG: hypothetical protein JW772_02425 [Candidatus Diapherotrites archaeon]|nr:hypothetical protein [Candidatus Diapherotrites archaeon]